MAAHADVFAEPGGRRGGVEDRSRPAAFLGALQTRVDVRLARSVAVLAADGELGERRVLKETGTSLHRPRTARMTGEARYLNLPVEAVA